MIFPVFTISSSLLWIIFILFSIGVFVMSLILSFHWWQYGMKKRLVVWAQTVYLIVAILLWVVGLSLVATF